MTTPSRSGAPDAGAPASARSASGRARSEAERQQQLLQALTTEHFTLQTARAATIADSNGRAALYLGTVSGGVIALAFIGQVADVGKAFFLFAFALLPALVLLGILTYLRLLQTSVEDLFYARAINRIRHHYVHLDPDAARWFLLTSHDDPPAVMVNMGMAAPRAKHSQWQLLGHLLSHTATMIAVVTSIIGGVFVALAVGALGAGAFSVTAAAGVGVVVALLAIAAFGWHQARRWRAAEDSVPSLFPSSPGPIAPVSSDRGQARSYGDHPEDSSD
jgi:MFS family permease